MSDDNINNVHANEGITLPNNINATHDVSLTPLYINRSGRGNAPATSEYASTYRGMSYYGWSRFIRSLTQVYRAGSSSSVMSPSAYSTPVIPLSLRCLVSTNNE